MPMTGIRVVDFSQAFSGPMCGMMLGDFGAEVIKVEPPGGDNARKWGTSRYGKNDEFSAQYLSVNRNKNSIVIDLKKPEGVALARRIIEKSDVVIENFKPGVMKRLGLGYEDISKANPKIVYCSISGFGQTGPLSARPGYDQLMQAYAGQLSVTGEPGRTAVRIGPSSIDTLTGAYACIGIMMGLRERDQSGKGQYVDTSLYEASLQMITHFLADYSGSGKLMGRTGPYFPFLAPYGMFMAKNREFYMGVARQGMWTRLCEALGREDLVKDPRFLTNGDRTKNMRALYDILEPIFRTETAEHWFALCEKLDIPTSLLHDLDEVVDQEQAVAREAVVQIDGAPAGMRSAGIPIKLSRTPGKLRKGPPSLGTDAEAILKRVGIPDVEIDKLKADKIVL